MWSVHQAVEYRQVMKSWICHKFIGFQRYTKIHINTDLLRVNQSVRPSLYPFYSQYCVHILSNVFRSTTKQPTEEVNSKELLEHLKSPNFNLITSIKSFDFSTLYTTISHQKLKSTLATIIRDSFIHKKWKSQIQIFGFRSRRTLFCQGTIWFEKQVHWRWHNSHARVSSRNIFVVFGGKGSQIVGIRMGTNCAPLLADIFLYSYEAECIQSLLSTRKKQLASQFNFTYRYIEDVSSIDNPYFGNYLGQMYPAELEIKDTTESSTSASYLNLLLSIGRDGQLRTSLYDKRDDFNFHITNIPFLSSNIPSSPPYGVFFSQIIRYTRAWSSNGCFILRAATLSCKLLGKGYVKERLKSSFG